MKFTRNKNLLKIKPDFWDEKKPFRSKTPIWLRFLAFLRAAPIWNCASLTTLVRIFVQDTFILVFKSWESLLQIFEVFEVVEVIETLKNRVTKKKRKNSPIS